MEIEKNNDTIPILANFDDVKQEIWESDLLLIRNINGRYVLAAKATWWDGELFCIAVHQYHGVTCRPLDQLVRSCPSLIDIYEVNPQNLWENYDRQGANTYLKNNMVFKVNRCDSVTGHLLNLFLYCFNRTNTKIVKTPYGAEAIRRAERIGGGVEPMPNKVDTWIETNDLALSSFYRYRFTLK